MDKIFKFFIMISVAYPLYGQSTKSEWANKRVNQHLQKTEDQIHQKREKAYINQQKQIQESDLQNKEFNKNKQQFLGIDDYEDSYNLQDFSDQSNSEEFYSPVDEAYSNVNSEREYHYNLKARDEQFVKQFIENARKDGHKVIVDKDLNVRIIPKRK